VALIATRSMPTLLSALGCHKINNKLLLSIKRKNLGPKTCNKLAIPATRLEIVVNMGIFPSALNTGGGAV